MFQSRLATVSEIVDKGKGCRCWQPARLFSNRLPGERVAEGRVRGSPEPNVLGAMRLPAKKPERPVSPSPSLQGEASFQTVSSSGVSAYWWAFIKAALCLWPMIWPMWGWAQRCVSVAKRRQSVARGVNPTEGVVQPILEVAPSGLIQRCNPTPATHVPGDSLSPLQD